MKKVTLLVGLIFTQTTQLHCTNYLESWINYFSTQAQNGYTYVQNIDWNTHSKNINTQVQHAYAQIPTQEQIVRTIQENPEKTAAAGFFATIVGLKGLQSYWSGQKVAREKNKPLAEEDLSKKNEKNFKQQLIDVNQPAEDFTDVYNQINTLKKNYNNLNKSIKALQIKNQIITNKLKAVIKGCNKKSK